MIYKKNISAMFPGVFKLLGSEEKGKHSNAAMFVVYMYLAHQFCSTDKNCVRLSYDDISKGTLVDRGTGLSKGAIARALKSLLVLKLTEENRSEVPAKGGLPPMTIIRYKVFCPTLGEKGQLIVKHFVSPNIDFARPENRPGLNNDRPLPSPLNGSIPSLRSVIKPATKGGEVLLNSTSIEVTKKPSKLHPLLTLTAKTSEVVALNPAQEIAQELWIKLGDRRKRDKKSSISSWAKRIQEFLSIEPPIDIERVRRVLKWYLKNIGKKYVSRAFCASTFCEKFSNIEAEMLDQQAPTNPADRTWTDQQGPSSLEEPELTEEVEELHNQTMVDKI